MDYVHRAKEMLAQADHNYASQSEANSGIVQAQIATAYAILALVERLDKITSTDGLDESAGCLMVDAGIQ